MSTNNSIMHEHKQSPDDTQIQVQIIDAKGLYKCDLFGISPYVTVFSGEETLPRCKTKVHKKTCNPKFNEMLQFYVSNWRRPTPKPMTIRVECYAHSKSDKHEFLGHASVHFRDHKSLYTANGKWVELWLKLEKQTPKQKVTGDVHVGIRCIDPQEQQKRASVSLQQLNLAQEKRQSISIANNRKSAKQGKGSSKMDIEKSIIQFESTDRILKTDVPHKFVAVLKDARGVPITEGLAAMDWSITIVNVMTGDIIDTDSIERSLTSDGSGLEFEFCPTEAGDYTVTVTINDNERLIPQRFEVIPVVDASNTHLYGSLIERGNCLDSDECEFMLSLRDKRNNPLYSSVGSGFVKAQYRKADEAAPFTPCTVTHLGESNFKIRVMNHNGSAPLPIGEYLVDVEVAGVKIGDPFAFHIGKSTSLENTQILNLPAFKKILSPFSFLIMACDADGNPKQDGGDKFTVEITNKANNKRINSFVTDLNNGQYNVSSILPEVGLYQITVLLSGQHVHTMSITARQTISPYHCVVSEIPRCVSKGSEIEFTIHMKDIHGNPSHLDDDADIFEVAVLNNFDGNYLDMDAVQIEEIPAEGDAFSIKVPFLDCAQYLIDLKVNDEALGQIPVYTIDVHNDVIEPNNTVFSGPGTKKAYIANVLTGISVQLQDANGLKIPYSAEKCAIGVTLASRSGSVVPIDVNVKLTSEENALIEYSLTDDSVTRGLYTLNISLNEEVVKSLPISVVNSNAPDASKTEFFGQANSGSVDTLYSFKLKLNNSDNKSLNIGNDFVVVTFSNKSESSASIVDLQNGTYSVQWTPKEEGDYSINVSVNGVSVPMSNNVVHVAKRNVNVTQVINRSFEVCTFDTTGESMNDAIGAPENMKNLSVVFDKEEEAYQVVEDGQVENAQSVAHSIEYIGGGKFRVQFLCLTGGWSGMIKVFHKESMIGSIKYAA